MIVVSDLVCIDPSGESDNLTSALSVIFFGLLFVFVVGVVVRILRLVSLFHIILVLGVTGLTAGFVSTNCFITARLVSFG